MPTEVRWSGLQRDPKGVAALADQGDVRLRRQDGVPLLRVRADRADAAAVGALSAAGRCATRLLLFRPTRRSSFSSRSFPG